jgi:AmmeMemoRadiSam system protein B/AmmeMemoRadiSam system protein A
VFNENEKRELLAIAREAIECTLKGTVFKHRVPMTDALSRPAGGFVTIRIQGELRGCIGYIESEKPLSQVVAEVAAKAATEDPRFSPLSVDDFERASVEVSILSPLRRISSIEEIEIGRHGLVVALGERRGLLLPQVATEYHLDREAFLEATIRKAGLPLSAARLPNAHLEMYVFEAEVAREQEVVKESSPRKKTIRRPAVAGMFYSADSKELHRQIEDLIRRVKTKKPKGRICGIVAPHAGYMYSGLTAAHGYSMLRGETFETVVVVSPSHREFFSGVSVYPGDAYETPFGLIEVNAALRDALTENCDFIVASERGHGAEHALEVQLPFLQEVLPPFTLLPLVIGDQKPDICFRLGEALANVLRNENALLVASTDLSHFYSSAVAEKLDEVMMKDVGDFDCEALMLDLETQRTEACGGGPVVAVMAALKLLGAKTMKVVHHSNSGETSGDYDSVVGYLSAVAYS